MTIDLPSLARIGNVYNGLPRNYKQPSRLGQQPFVCDEVETILAHALCGRCFESAQDMVDVAYAVVTPYRRALRRYNPDGALEVRNYVLNFFRRMQMYVTINMSEVEYFWSGKDHRF